MEIVGRLDDWEISAIKRIELERLKSG